MWHTTRGLSLPGRLWAALVLACLAAVGLTPGVAQAAGELTARQQGTAVHLAWTTLSPADQATTPDPGQHPDHYTVRYSDTADPASLTDGTAAAPPGDLIPGDATSVDLPLPPATGTWHYTLFAISPSGDVQAQASAAAEVVVDQPPVVVTIDGRTSTGLTVHWSGGPSTAVGQRVDVFSQAEVGAAGFSPRPDLPGVVSGSGGVLVATGLQPDTTYYAYVFPMLADGGWDSPGSGVAATLPAAVTDLTGTVSSTGSGTISLRWDYATNPTSFRISARQGAAPSSTTCSSGCTALATPSGTARSFLVTAGSLGGQSAMAKPWYFAITALTPNGQSPLTVSAAITPWNSASLAASAVTGTPGYRQATSTTPSSYTMTLRWRAPVSAWHKVTIVQTKGSTPSTSQTTGVIYSCTKSATQSCSARSKTTTGLTNGTHYAWTIWTYDAAGHKSKATYVDLARMPGAYINGSYVRGPARPTPTARS